jgi:hypothetical protein
MERDNTDFFIPIWMEAGFRFTPRFFLKQTGPFRIGVLTFPMPREQTEGWLGVVVARSDAPPWFRYFIWEKSVDLMSGAETAVTGEWRGTTHVNHGPAPDFAPDDIWVFVDGVLRLCGLSPSP